MIRLLILIAAIAVPIAAQTTTQPSNLGIVPAGAQIAIIGPDGKFAFARIDTASLQLVVDNASGLFVLRAIAPPASAPVTDRAIVFKVTDANQTTITLPTAPQGQSLMVTRNGQVLAPGEDYTLTGLVLSFVPQHRPTPGQVFQVRYRE